MADLLVARHGETDWNRDHRVQGQTDVDLNPTGRAQAEALARSLADTRLGAVYSSDLTRALETAEAVARPRGLRVLTDPDLREKNFGSWEGLTDVEIAERFPEAVRGRWGDGETTEDVAARVLPAVERIRARHPHNTVLVVTHGGPIRVILDSYGVAHGRIGNCELFQLA